VTFSDLAKLFNEMIHRAVSLRQLNMLQALVSRWILTT